MARRKRREGEHVAGKDYGPNIRRDAVKLPLLPSEKHQIDADLELRRANAAALGYEARREVEKEDRPDPWKVTGELVRGGRVRDPLLRMLRTHTITKREMHGVDAFRDDVAIAYGARIAVPEDAGVRSGYSNTNWPAERQLLALDRVRRTWRLMSPEQRHIIAVVIMDRRSLDDFAVSARIRRSRAPELLAEVLDMLAKRHRYRADERPPKRTPTGPKRTAT